ncbi:MAG: hypothetical protein K8R49_04570 [Candidatus Cloacimonetes bacterium]|nr:hypothetical protein [Candidatus Cloacimonadota bacterium]
MKSDINKIFSKSSCLTNSEMLEYLSGKLSNTEKRRIEMHIADCEMCNDELEGLSNMKNPDSLSTIIHSVNSDIDTYLKQFNKSKVKKTAKTYNIKRIFAVAASVLLIISAGFTVNYFMKNNSESLADMQKIENLELPEKNADMTEKEVINNESVTHNIAGSSVDEDNFSTVVVEQSGENSIDEIISGELDKNTETTADDDISDRNLKDEVEENIPMFGSDISKNKIINSELNNKLVTTTSEEDGEVAKEEENDDFIGFSTRHVPNENNKAKKEDVIKYKSIRNSAIFSYNEKVYNEASDGFEKYLKYKSNDSEIIYKYGVSSFYTKNYNNALKNFDKIISSGNNKYLEDAEWYKTQTLIKLGRNKEAKGLLQKIVSRNGKHKNKASDVLKQLN